MAFFCNLPWFVFVQRVCRSFCSGKLFSLLPLMILFSHGHHLDCWYKRTEIMTRFCSHTVQEMRRSSGSVGYIVEYTAKKVFFGERGEAATAIFCVFPTLYLLYRLASFLLIRNPVLCYPFMPIFGLTNFNTFNFFSLRDIFHFTESQNSHMFMLILNIDHSPSK